MGIGIKTFGLWKLVLSLTLVNLIGDGTTVDARSQPFLETNEISYAVTAVPNPVCGENSICTYLQANVRGINNQKLCSCISGTCSLVWDPFDGHSVTQGSDQYKFCGKAPKVSTCEPNHVAYTSKTVFSKATGEKLSQIDHITCICPESHNYEIATQHYGDSDAENDVLDISYVCAPLPVCGPADICKFVSETSETFLVNQKCNCPGGYRCPTLSEHPNTETFGMGNGFVHPVRCRR